MIKVQRISWKRSPLGWLMLLLCLFGTSVNAQISLKTDLGGYVKELGSFSFANDLKPIHFDNILHHRLESKVKLTQEFSIRADLRTRMFNGWTVQEMNGYGDLLSRDAGYFDLSHTFIDTDKLILNAAIDRLQLSYIQGPWDIHVGRQRINWGKTMVWNPNDLFNAYAYLDFDYEERPGTDAVYTRYSWSYASSVEAGYRIGKSWNESVLGFMYRGSIGEYDVQAIAGNYFDQLALGVGWSGYVKSMGFKGEVTYFAPRDEFLQNYGHLTATLGSDYMFPNAVYVNAEILYNGGWNKSANALGALTRPPRADDLFIAETGYFLNASFAITPLTSINGGILGSFDRKMVILIPQVSRSISDNVDLLVLMQMLKGSVFTDITDTTNLLFIRLKWSY